MGVPFLLWNNNRCYGSLSQFFSLVPRFQTLHFFQLFFHFPCCVLLLSFDIQCNALPFTTSAAIIAGAEITASFACFTCSSAVAISASNAAHSSSSTLAIGFEGVAGREGISIVSPAH